MKVTLLEKQPGVWRLRIETVDGATGERKFAYETIKGTHDEASRRRYELLTKAEQGTWSEPSKLTVEGFLDKWLDRKATMGQIGRLTKENLAGMIRKHLVPAFGATRLQRLSAEQIQDLYTAMLKKGLARLTVANFHKNVLSPAMKDARKSRLIVVNPMDEITPPKQDDPEPKAFDGGELDLLLRVIEGAPIRDIILTILGTGMRRGEACGLRWQDVDLTARVLHVRGELVQYQDGTLEWKAPKTKAGVRTVSLPAQVVELLTELRTVNGTLNLASVQGEAYVFTNAGAPYRPNTLSKIFKRLCERVGIEGRGALHRLRHTHVTTLLRSVGKERAKAVAQRVGHANVMVTLHVYQTVFEHEDRELGDMAAGLFGKRGVK